MLRDIQLLKNHLFATYAKINEQDLLTKYDETTKLHYNVSDPIDDICNAVEELCEITEFIQMPYSAR